MENKTKSSENKSHNILQVPICNKGRTCFIFIRGDLLSYYPHIKFLGITFDNRMTFTKHFEEILECCNQKFHRLRILVNKKWGPSPETILQIYKQMCKTNIRIWDCFYHNCFGNCHHKNTKSPELFH